MTSAPKKKLRSYLSPRLLLFAMIGALMALYACYPGGATNVGDFDLVITLFDENIDYSAQNTYSMPDSVVQIPDTTQTIDPATQATILNTVAANMAALGYTRIANPDPANQPDVVILCTSTTSDFAAWVSYPWYGGWGWWGGWGYYPPGYGGGWGWGYPPSGGAAYSYTVGTIVITMMKAVPTPAEESDMELPVVWGAGINGLAEGGGDQKRIEDAINQAYAQSPYLDT